MPFNDLSNLSLTSRDYTAIYTELLNAIPNLTESWDTVEDTDPGIVLIKLMSMLGDMLSYNQDKSILELYPSTVTQRKNAMQIFKLMGYKMRWYRSAEVKAVFSYTGRTTSSNIIIPAFSSIITEDGTVEYTNLQEISVPSTGINTDEVTLIQGVPKTPMRVSQFPINVDESKVWHDVYGYNVQDTMIINNRIYLSSKNIDEKHIVLIDNSAGQEKWTIVDDIDKMTSDGKYFQLMLDEDDNPYIELVSHWNTMGITKFKLFYIISDGIDGAISYNTLNKVKSGVYTRNKEKNTIQTVNTLDVLITNAQSTLGYDPETPSDARKEVAKYINTYDTLVTVEDFKKAVSNITGVLNCHVTDLVTDVRDEFEINKICIYVIRDPSYYPEGTNASSDVDIINQKFATEIINVINSKKAIPVVIECVVDNQNILVNNTMVEGIKLFEWAVKAKIYFNTNLNNGDMNNIATAINNTLKQKYDKKIAFNTAPLYLDIIDDIKNTDSRIRYVEMDNITYKTKNDDNVYTNDDVLSDYVVPVTETEVSNTCAVISVIKSINLTAEDKDELSVDNDDEDIVQIQLAHENIIPSTLVLMFDNGDFTIMDNGDFRIMGQTTINNMPVKGSLISDNFLFIIGNIDYKSGKLLFKTNKQEIAKSMNVMCKYSVRAVNLTSYTGISNVVQVSNDCMVIN